MRVAAPEDRKMNLSVSEWLLYGGIGIMAAAAVIVAAGVAAFTLTGRKLGRKLEEEYGKPSIGRN